MLDLITTIISVFGSSFASYYVANKKYTENRFRKIEFSIVKIQKDIEFLKKIIEDHNNALQKMDGIISDISALKQAVQDIRIILNNMNGKTKQ